MQHTISIGFDPMPPGKYPLVKALCDSDFDGCVCAAILKTVYPDLQLFFSDPGKVQAGNLNDWVDTQTVIADLPYISGCGIYFDHHIGNKPQQAHPGRWENSPSAAEILYRYYQAYPGIAKFSCVIAELGRFDSGNVTLADIKNPSSYFNIGFAIDRQDHEFIAYLANLLAQKPWAEAMLDEVVKAKVDKLLAERRLYLDYIKKHTVIKNNIAFLDMQKYTGKAGHSYFVTLGNPEVDGIVMIKNIGQETRFTLFRNALQSEKKDVIDFLKIAKTLNPELSGGHRGSCGFVLNTSGTVATTIPEAIAKIIELVEAQRLQK